MYDCRMSSGSLTHCPTCTGDSSCVCACPTCDKTRAAAQRSTCADCGEPARGGFCGDGYCIVKTRTILVGLESGHKVRLRDGEPVITVSQAELARLLFASRPAIRELAEERAEIDGDMQECDVPKVQRVLDIMWDKTEPEWRESCERSAARIFQWAKK